MTNDDTTGADFVTLGVAISQAINDLCRTPPYHACIADHRHTGRRKAVVTGLFLTVLSPVLNTEAAVLRLKCRLVEAGFLDRIVEAAPLARAERTQAQFGYRTSIGTLQQSVQEVKSGILPFAYRRKNVLAKCAKVSILLIVRCVHKCNLHYGKF